MHRHIWPILNWMERSPRAWGSYWKHLRVPFQLTLAPLFLWGAHLSDGRQTTSLALSFVAFHFFLYTGATAYNSAYDRDEGPVGGMRRPPRVPDGLLHVSILLQAIGTVIALAAGMKVLLLYLLFLMLSFAYSHPSVRLKRHPILSSLTVFFGQGILGFAAGWTAATGEWGTGSDRFLLGAAAAALTTFGFYPLTQIFQIEEDTARGDRTLASTLGVRRAVALGAFAIALGGVCASVVTARNGSVPGSLLIASGYTVIVVEAVRIGRLSPSDSFSRVLRLHYVASLGLFFFIFLRHIHVV